MSSHSQEKIFICDEPEYISLFNCHGEFCKAKCCRGWQVDIDRHTHEKYRKIKNAEWRKKILDALIWNEESQTYRVKLENASCPMLDENYLCSIQKNFGEDYLSDSCAQFPRRVHVVGDTVIRSLSMTCPIASRLALMNPQPMKFRKVELHTRRSDGFFYRSVNEVPTRKFLPILQMTAIDLLQNRELSLDKRLAAVGFTMMKLDNVISDPKIQTKENLSDLGNSPGFFDDVSANLFQLEFDLKSHLKLMFGLMEALFHDAMVYYSEEQRNFAQYVPQAFDLVENTSKSFDELFELYKKNFDVYQVLIGIPYAPILENYAVHIFFSGLYPCRIPASLTTNFLLFATLFKFFEFGLISMAAVLRENLRLDDIMEFIERFTNRIDHALLFQNITLDFLANFSQDTHELFSSLFDIRH